MTGTFFCIKLFYGIQLSYYLWEFLFFVWRKTLWHYSNVFFEEIIWIILSSFLFWKFCCQSCRERIWFLKARKHIILDIFSVWLKYLFTIISILKKIIDSSSIKLFLIGIIVAYDSGADRISLGRWLIDIIVLDILLNHIFLWTEEAIRNFEVKLIFSAQHLS